MSCAAPSGSNRADMPMNTRNKQQWALLFFGVLVAFAIAANVAWQHKRAEESRNVGLLLVKIEQKVNELQSLHWQVLAQGTVDEKFLERMRAARLDLLDTGETLKQSTHGRKELDSFFTSYTRYVTSVDQELLLVGLNKTDDISRLEREALGPSYEELEAATREAQDQFGLSAMIAARDADAGALLSLMGFSVVMLFLFARYEQARRVAEIAVAEQTALRQNEGLLEERVKERTTQLESATRAAENANRVKSMFLANMSHELRTPLNAIIGYSEMLEEEAKERTLEDAIPDLRRIHEAGRHLLALINDVLDLSKVESGKMALHWAPLSVSSMIRSVAPSADMLAKKNRNTFIVRPAEDYTFWADETRFCQVLTNLISNALKFTKDGTVILEVCRESSGGKDWLHWSVTDTGIGIAQEDRAKLFQPFTQVDNSATRRHQGTGLGLAISKRFCEMMGGSIEFSSEVGHGSRFTILIPMVAESSQTDQVTAPVGLEEAN
jgi:signal transduction histidine kinase